MAEGRKIEERQESLKQCLADNQSALYVEGLLVSGLRGGTCFNKALGCINAVVQIVYCI